jgi:protein required for attachment to host cells
VKLIRTWILITDGARARVVLNTGPGHGIEAVDGFDFRSPNLASRAIEADRPGRTFDSQGPGRHHKEPSRTAHDRQEQEFVTQLAGFIDDQLKKDSFDRLILVAAPRALGDLRAAISDSVRNTVIAEVDKDLTHIPNDRLAKFLEDVLAV